MKIFTTINPYGNYEAQTEALLSWSKYYDVYSINCVNEIEIAKDKFPFINFIQSDKIFTYKNKNLIKLTGILDVIKSNVEDHSYFCIINSDIILTNKIETSCLKSDLLISTRWELDVDKEPYPFNNGYDLFIFKKNLIDLFYNDNYVIGMPWWDYWVPLIAIKMGYSVNHINNPIIFHRTHETNYDGNIWIKFGEYLYKDIIINLMGRKIDVDVYTFCKTVKNFIESKQKNIEI